ncbi:DNA internalization-related competence protein ComEC/Rec2 [Geobacter sp. DSM 9736]|uniref:DNA internalization-related competence protein ComEC/Rec2 n=1 Tax=Geobacter sp. DSM 9736 TaxID=1277350 RepID=UPI000B616BC0|nr:DNA internalization-related competence protein ComEC/Rec2 [Geobacter sp. DSM 9736]SNB45313.1 competence protein ComEC [Geobacter sp. DSM 9736]
MERPLLLPLLSVIAGLSLASFSFFIPPLVSLPLLVVGVAALFPKSRVPFSIVISLLFLLWGNLTLIPFLNPQLPPRHISHFITDQEQIVEGVVDTRPQRTEYGSRLFIQAEKICRRDGYFPVSGRLLVTVEEGGIPYISGDRVRFFARLRAPRNYGLPGEYDYVRHLALRDVFVTAFVKRHDQIILMQQEAAFPLQRLLDRVAARIGGFLDTHAPPVEAAVLRALLIGEQGAVPRSLNDAYARSGVNHILSISGFHMGIIALVSFQLLFQLAARSEYLLLHCNLRRFILLSTLPVMIFYMLLSGGAPATLRSVIMLAALMLGLALERHTEPLDSFVLAAFTILLLTPAALFDISFQLSFAALWGLLVLTPMLMSPFHNLQEGAPRRLLLFLAASVAATAATMLPVAYYFHRVSLAGLLSNFFIVPLMGYGAVVTGFLALPLIWIAPPLASSLVTVASFFVWLSNVIIGRLAALPVINSLNPTLPVLLLFFLFGLALTFLRGWARTACCTFAGGACIFFLTAGHFRGQGEMQIAFLSVGQGEATLITLPDGKHMLIDGGGRPMGGSSDGRSVGERLLAPALRSLGANKIDYLVLTHPHPDHTQGLLYVAENFSIGEFWEGEASVPSSEYLELKRILEVRSVPARRLNSASGAHRLGEVLIEPLSPSPRVLRGDINEDSLVFRLSCRGVSVLFTGDIGFSTEEKLLLRPELLKCTVLKVAHHGSRHSTSEKFLDAAAPKAALISAGYRNVFHLPSQQTVDRLSRKGVTIWRTDRDGTVYLSCDGSSGRWTLGGTRQFD